MVFELFTRQQPRNNGFDQSFDRIKAVQMPQAIVCLSCLSSATSRRVLRPPIVTASQTGDLLV